MTKASAKVSEGTQVFAYCVFADNINEYAYYRVAAKRGPEGGFAKVNDATREFPNRGAIRVLKRNLHLGSSRKGNHGVFTLEYDPNFDAMASNPNAVMYRATAIAGCGIQIVRIPFSQQETDEIGEQLKSGVHVLGEPIGKTHVLLELNDGTITGPILLRPNGESEIYHADEQSLLTLKGAWKGMSSLRVLPLEIDHHAHNFVFGELPPSEFALDLSPGAFAIKRALEFLIDQKLADGILSKNKARDLAQILSKQKPSDELKARCQKLLVQLERYQSANEECAKFIDEVVKTPVVKARLEQEASAAEERVRSSMTREISQLREKINAAKASLTTIEDEKKQAIEELQLAEQKILSAEKQFAQVEMELGKRLKAHFEKAQTDTAELLANVAILRPFFVATGEAQKPVVALDSPASASKSAPQINWWTQTQPNALQEPREIYSHLLNNLSLIGMKEASAGRVAAACAAAFSAGQAVTVRGSAAGLLSNALAVSYFGGHWPEIAVPVGYSDLFDLGRLKAEAKELPAGILLIGANRSCLDAYTGSWLDQYRMGGNDNKGEGGAMLILSLCEGPSALSVTSQPELGPVIHTDALSWGRRGSGTLSPGSFLGKVVARKIDWDEEAKLLDEVFVGSPNASAQLAARSAFPLLAELAVIRGPENLAEDKATREALSAVAAWWLGPTLASMGKGRDLLARVEATLPDDKILKANLEILFGAGTAQ